MKPASFEYLAPESLDEALGLLAEGGDTRPLAGGQSLVPMLNLRLAPAERVIDLGRIAALRAVLSGEEAIVYGALTPHAAFEDARVPDAAGGLLRETGAGIAFRAIRTRGTLGGSLALADPAADWLVTALALEARLHLRSGRGSRIVPAADFVLGAYTTVLEPDELLCAVEVGRRPAGERWGRCKIVRKVGEYADSLCVALRDREAGRARIVLGALDGAPLVLARTAAALADDAKAGAWRDILEDELLEQGVGDAPVRRRHSTCVRRAVAAVFAREEA